MLGANHLDLDRRDLEESAGPRLDRLLDLRRFPIPFPDPSYGSGLDHRVHKEQWDQDDRADASAEDLNHGRVA